MAPPVLVGVPTNLTIRAGDGQVDLVSWDLVNSAQSYRVAWLSDPAVLSAASTGPVSHTALTNGLRYVYTVTADTQLADLTAVPVPADSSSPSSVSITPGLRDNTISWAPVAGATGYRVYWSYEPNVTPTTGTRIDVDGSQTSYTHADLAPGTYYCYVVTAVLSTGTQGTASAEVGAHPGETTPVTATVSDAHVDLAWSETVSASVEVATNKMFDVGFTPSFPISLLNFENDRRYQFSVQPVFSNGLGPPSTDVYVTPKAAVTGAPQSVTLAAGRGVNSLSWEPVAGATTYDVTWTAIDFSGTLVDSGTRTVDQPLFRHGGLQMCATFSTACPTYSYLVQVSQSGQLGPLVEAFSIDLRAVPPLVTNITTLIIVGMKPPGTRVDVNDLSAIPFDFETWWGVNLLFGEGDGTYVGSLVAIDENGLASIETRFQVMVDTVPPAPLPPATVVRCDPPTASPRRVTLEGFKEAGSAVFRAMEPIAPDQLIAGATERPDWSGVLEVEDQSVPIELVAKDVAGNSSPQSVTVDLTNCP